jgi:signal transduction histidine kinase
MHTPRPTARLRLTILYGSVFLVCGTAVLAITYVLFWQATNLPVVAKGGRVTGVGGVSAPLSPLQIQALQAQSQFGGGVAVAVRQQVFDLQQLLIQSGIALAIVAVAAILLGWLIAGRVLRPLSVITAAARRISASSLHERLAMRGPDDELKELGDTLDDLFARLESSFKAQRNFVANASHELRTPITRERTLLQVTLADPAATTSTWEAVSRELLTSNTEQERLIEALFILASSEGGLDHRERVDLAAITNGVLADSGRRGVHVEAEIWTAALEGDPMLIRRLVANLVDNALTHNIPGGRVEITAKTLMGRSVLSVTNTGPAIPAADVDRLFQPFQRLGARRVRQDNGHGLGLSIVAAIATAHGATIAAKPLASGGLAITVTFPPPSAPPVRDVPLVLAAPGLR